MPSPIVATAGQKVQLPSVDDRGYSSSSTSGEQTPDSRARRNLPSQHQRHHPGRVTDGWSEYAGYSASEIFPNVVIDGSPNDSTVLTLTHWPGYPQPVGYHFDLSAEMAFHFLDAPIEHSPADIVTNNHFDQDGLVGLHALIDPEQSLRHRQLLIEIASAGDFAKTRDPRAARTSMTIDAYADVERSPIADRLTGSYDAQCVALYEGRFLAHLDGDGDRTVP